MVNTMKYLLILLTLCCAIVRPELHSPIRSSEFKDNERYMLHTDDIPRQRSLLRSNNVKDIEETTIPVVVTSPLNQQIWIGPTKFNEAIEKGLSNVVKFLMGWFIFMCVVGTIMRCFLCCDNMRSERNYNLLSLYNSFIDNDCENESQHEGIALSFSDTHTEDTSSASDYDA